MASRYYSTGGKVLEASLRDCVLQALPEDQGLYLPHCIPQLDVDFFQALPSLSFPEIAYHVSEALLGDDLPKATLRSLVEEAVNFDAPLVEVEESTAILELFHGPTLAFKDFGARFMARLMGYFIEGSSEELTILVATSGDTGSAVAHGFWKVPGIRVIILYPQGQVSPLQEKQLTTMGHNITTLEVQGTFDDCQKLVKTAFADKTLNTTMHLTSANSINIARLIPQSFYYFYAYACCKSQKPLVFSVPSGNFGNLTGGLLAKRMGLPVERFIAATNRNDVFHKFLSSGEYHPQPSVRTLSNAMDVGAPSNFARIWNLYNKDLKALRRDVWSASFDDTQTVGAMRNLHQKTGYTIDPHGAVAYLAWKEYQKHHDQYGIVLETAHPAKFLDVAEKAYGTIKELPKALAAVQHKKKVAQTISTEYSLFREFLQTPTVPKTLSI